MSFEALYAPLIQPPLPWFSLGLAIFTAWLMGFSRSGLGAGGFVVSPLMVLALGAKDGLAVIAVIMIPAGCLGCWQYRKNVDRKLLNPLIPAAFVGTALGALILWALIASGEETVVHQRMEYVVAGLSLVYVALVSFRDKIAQLGGGGGPATPKGVFSVGSLLALSQTVANSGSPLITVYFVRHGLEKKQFVAAQNFFLLIQNTIKLIPFVALGVLHIGNAGAALLLFPLTLLGSWNGKQFNRASSEKSFFALYIVLLVIGFVSSVILLWGRSKFLGLF
ncbi:sulfite exporter TauE/SafE family protein [Cerasicoccus fimbriatus]|uniref:sulfite exporter TauE/SafE family protein n=1 Tax=Cerasicoccus fimbriatus TaxID=3014554 RepID=UPI0022B57E44|nr:sulfite exporter TauE/SafE family protein [Cerasicoccus sp. TK19100]